MNTATKQDLRIETAINELICVSKPYYALQDVEYLGTGKVRAKVVVENPHTGELTPISASEAGRHAAILGSLALALHNPESVKHYYLAAHAVLNRLHPVASSVPSTSTVIIEAEVLQLDLAAKQGKVQTTLYTAAGLPLLSLEVSYHVFKKDLFAKLFRRYHQDDTPAKDQNPYTQNTPLFDVTLTENQLTASLGIIQTAQCLGHFDHYPALPVAILCNAMIRHGGLHVGRLTFGEGISYAVRSAVLTANSLAFAGQEVLLNSTVLHVDTDEFRLLVRATDRAGRTISTIDLVYDHIEPTTEALSMPLPWAGI